MQCRTSYFHPGHHSQVQAYLQYMCNDISACLFPCHVYHACDYLQILVTVGHVACIQLQANPDCQSAMVIANARLAYVSKARANAAMQLTALLLLFDSLTSP